MTQLPEGGYRFGDVELDVLNLRLTVSGVQRPLEPKSFRLLQFLIENRSRVVPKDEILNVVWAGVAVSDNALTRAIAQVRKALDDDPKEPRYIETIPTVGYRFLAPVNVASINVEPPGEPAAAMPAPRPTRRYLTAAAVGALALAGIFFYLRRPPRLSDKDTIVLSDFVNKTDDPVFDGTLRQGLAIQLEQSPFLKIMDDAQIRRDLPLMSLPPGSQITNQIAHDICIRHGATATIDGSIASLGKNYVITLEAVTCQTGATLAREQIQAEDKEHILKALGTAVTAMRAKLGESLSSIEKLNRPLEQVTTPSLEALQSFSAGQEAFNQGRFLAAVPLLERATALDPNFAMAYRALTFASSATGTRSRNCEYTSKAFALIDRVSELEREFIAGDYYLDCTGELDKAIEAFQLGIRNYPREASFRVDLSATYRDEGQFENSLKASQEALRLQPGAEPQNLREMVAYIELDRFGEAKKTVERARMHGLDGAIFHTQLLVIGFIEGDQTVAEKEIRWFQGKPEEYLSLSLQSRQMDALGRRREARELFRRASEIALRQALSSVASNYSAVDALADALTGNCQTARSLGRPPFALAFCGDAAQAEKFAAATSKQFPNGTIWNAVQLPAIHAAIELKLDQPAKAVDLLAQAVPFEHAYSVAPYLRGLALLRLQKGAEAASEFKKILDHKGANWGIYHSLSHLELARALALAGDRTNAEKAFQEFFAIWKAADSDLPILTEAKADYAKLK